jgi:hypothetical protein
MGFNGLIGGWEIGKPFELQGFLCTPTGQNPYCVTLGLFLLAEVV